MPMKRAAPGALISTAIVLGLALGGGARDAEAAGLRLAADRPDLSRTRGAGPAAAPLLTPVRDGRGGIRGGALRGGGFEARAVGGGYRRTAPLLQRPPYQAGAVAGAWAGSRAWRGDPAWGRRYYPSTLRRRPWRGAPYYGYYGGWGYPYGWGYAGWPSYAAPGVGLGLGLGLGLGSYNMYYDTMYYDTTSCYSLCRTYYGPRYCRRYARYYCF